MVEADADDSFVFGSDEDVAEMDSDDAFVFADDDDDIVEAEAAEPGASVEITDAVETPKVSTRLGEEVFSQTDVLDALNDTSVASNPVNKSTFNPFGEMVDGNVVGPGGELDLKSSTEVFSNTEVLDQLNDTSLLGGRSADAEALVDDSGELDLSSIAAAGAAAVGGVAALGAAFAFGDGDEPDQPDAAPTRSNPGASSPAETSAREASLKAKVASLNRSWQKQKNQLVILRQ